MAPTPVFRPTARLIVLDPGDRTLLFSFVTASGRTGWFTPGGGLRKGETLEAAAVRELAEETGFAVPESDVGPVVATRGGQWRAAEKNKIFFGADSFLCVRVPHTEVSTDGHEALEASVITGYRWWTAAELRTTTDRITPPSLPDLVSQLLTSGVPEVPVRLPWRVQRV